MHPRIVSVAPRLSRLPRRVLAPPGAIVLLALLGCGAPHGQNADAGPQAASAVRVLRPRVGEQWYGRLVVPELLPPESILPINDRLSLIVLTPEQAAQTLSRAMLPAPRLPEAMDRKSLLVAVAARVGEPLGAAWPAQVQELRLRGDAAEVVVRFDDGVYRPVDAPSFVHLVVARGVATVADVTLTRRRADE